jgi:hypothetical protein
LRFIFLHPSEFRELIMDFGESLSLPGRGAWILAFAGMTLREAFPHLAHAGGHPEKGFPDNR